MYCLQIRQFIIIGIDACAEEQASVPTINNLGHVAELHKVGLMFLIAGGYEAVDL